MDSFIPYCYLFPEDDDQESPSAINYFSGVIVDFEYKQNSISGDHFYWMLVKTMGGMVDVVADESLVTKTLKKGGVIAGHFWLTAKVLPKKTNYKNLVDYKQYLN